MNWIQILSQSKPMALPFEKPESMIPGYNDFQHEKSPIGLRKIDDRMTEETANEQQIRWPGVGYLGSGVFGVAVDLPNGFVGKYTYDEKEAKTAKAIMENPISGIVHIHSVEEVQRKELSGDKLQGSMWMIISEKVKTLDKRNSAFVTYLRNAFEYPNGMQKSFEYHKRTSRQLDVNEQLFNDYLELVKNLRINDIPVEDAHGDNIGYNRKGKLVLFDLGI